MMGQAGRNFLDFQVTEGETKQGKSKDEDRGSMRGSAYFRTDSK